LTNPQATEEFISAGFFVLRTPLLPVEEFLKIFSSHDRVSVRRRLREWVERPEVKEALWLASPELVQSLGAWQADPESVKARKLEQALYRYLARMTARATPFGTFAGCSVGTMGESTRLEPGPRSQYRRATRLDMEYLYSLAEAVSSDSPGNSNIQFRLNNSLHLVAGRYHHLCGEWIDGEHLFQLVSTDPTTALDATLLRASGGSTPGKLAAALVESDPDITPAQAAAFIAKLIESQMLVSELIPPVIGTDPARAMIGQLERGQRSDLASELRAATMALEALDQGGVGAALTAYDEIAATAAQLGGEFKPGRLVQVDLIKPAEATVASRLVNEVLSAVHMLHLIRGDSKQPAYEPFIEQFSERYWDQEVPLLEALDDEAGIGFENEDNPTSEPLIAGIDFRAAETTTQEDDKKPSPLLARRLEELRGRQGTVLELDSELLEELKVSDPLPLPDAFSVMGAVLPGEGFYLASVFGPSGANLLARFCHADAHLAEHVQRHLRAEEALHPGGAVFAEVTHLPEGRIGNVVCRPALRQYEIPFLATPGLPAERQIALADLTVSVREGRIVLRSRRLGCEVLPRLTCAHNFSHPRGLKLYKFLCLLQHQGACAEPVWNWGVHDQEAFLPRVARGNIVFALARWRVTKESAPELFTSPPGVEPWRDRVCVPRFVFVVEADNQLLIDFENPLSVETFLEHIRKRSETYLVEMLPGPEALAVRGPEGGFVHEMILPFQRRQRRLLVAGAKRAEVPDAAIADITPATESEWLFAKLYCSPSHADRLLLELVQPLVEELTDGALVRGWFFMRYADPRWHLRLRFHGDPAELTAKVLPALERRAASFQREGVLWRLRFDTYEPEMERYGGPAGILVAERFFQIDSELSLELLPMIAGDASGDLRWWLALAGADRLLSGLGLDTSEKKLVVETMRNLREQAWIADDSYRKQVARKFRSGELRRTLETVLNVADQASLLPAEALEALARFSERLDRIREKLQNLRQAESLTMSGPDLAISYVHMHLNRILRSCHLEQEAVICDFLARTYAARLARGRI
jgi:thiopeptide-type bacteriocin biosynthesis protein